MTSYLFFGVFFFNRFLILYVLSGKRRRLKREMKIVFSTPEVDMDPFAVTVMVFPLSNFVFSCLIFVRCGMADYWNKTISVQGQPGTSSTSMAALETSRRSARCSHGSMSGCETRMHLQKSRAVVDTDEPCFLLNRSRNRGAKTSLVRRKKRHIVFVLVTESAWPARMV